ncbi:MinD/ParA family protein [Microbacterium sp. ZXX196]|nr:MinD/ParA family protein [Microbacterium sp. ZXX196]
MLDGASVETTSLDLGGTSHVRVSLPAGYRDEDDLDDDVLADELPHDAHAATDEVAIAELDEDGDDDEPAEDESADQESADHESAFDEVAEDDASSDEVGKDDSERDEPERDAAATDGEEPELDETEPERDEPSAESVDGEEAEDTEPAAESAGGDGTEDAGAAPDPSGSEASAEAAADVAGDPAGDAPSDAVAASAVAVREPAPVAAAVSDEAAAAVVEASRPPRASFITPPARRAGDVGASAARESSDVLTADRLLETGAIRRPEPQDPWRRIVYSATRGVINLGDSKRTRARKELTARIAAPLGGSARFVPVLSRKGGVGKTTVTALVGMALADAREDRVVAVDANPDRGTLAERIAPSSAGKTVRDLVRGHDGIRGFGDISAHVTRDATRLDVLASDADPHVADAFSDADYRSVAEIAEHYYSIVLTDTGTGIVHSVMGATLEMADQLVIVSGLSVDEARLASETLTWLEANGHADKAHAAIVVLNQDSRGAPLVRIEELDAHFRSRVRHVVHLPYDARLATGSAIAFHELDRGTREAARELAALVVEGVRTA